jgi:hypothetical protein
MDARLSTEDRCDPGGRSCQIGSFGLCTFGGLHVTMRPNIPRVYVAQRDPGNGCWVHGDCLQIPIEQPSGSAFADVSAESWQEPWAFARSAANLKQAIPVSRSTLGIQVRSSSSRA